MRFVVNWGILVQASNLKRAAASFAYESAIGHALRSQAGDLVAQAQVVRSLGSSFVANVLEAAERNLRLAPRTHALIDGWPGDRAAAALAMRLNAALHALARQNDPAALARLFRDGGGDFDGAIGEALEAHDDFIAEWMRHPTQTNEVARSAAIMAALAVAAEQYGLPLDLLELGASAGLNLNLGHYRFRLGQLSAGDPSSPLLIAPKWLGASPPNAPVQVLSARGVDLAPIDVSYPAERERLLAYVWADLPERTERLELALALARQHRPKLDRGTAADWLEQRLQEPQAPGTCRVLYHSMFQQYLSPLDKMRVRATIAAAGALATITRPLAWVSFEWTVDRSEVRLTLTTYPDGKTRQLARCHPYGDWIEWR